MNAKNKTGETVMDKQHVLVTTEHRGVFFGTMDRDDGDTVVLKDARNCIYWSTATKGFLGLASIGPQPDCRIGPKVPSIKLHKVTAVAACTDEAVQKWEDAAWK